MDDLTLRCFLPKTSRRPIVAVMAIVLFTANWAAADATDPIESPRLFAAPSPPQVATQTADEVLLISTRPLGTSCDAQQMVQKLYCERFIRNPGGKSSWKSVAWQELVSEAQDRRPTVVYVHGNRIDRGEDRSRGLKIYRSLSGVLRQEGPIRYVIWSWPATQIPGPVKDYYVKAGRTRQISWQLAWFLRQTPEQTPVSVIGYSMGARVVSGAMHLLGGGRLGGLKIEPDERPHRPQIRVALVAAAVDADWIQPGGYHGRALSAIEKLYVVTNRRDPAMRYFYLSHDRGRIRALGWAGVDQPGSLGSAAKRVRLLDLTKVIGRNHGLTDYLAAGPHLSRIWRQLIPHDTRLAENDATHRSEPKREERRQ